MPEEKTIIEGAQQNAGQPAPVGEQQVAAPAAASDPFDPNSWVATNGEQPSATPITAEPEKKVELEKKPEEAIKIEEPGTVDANEYLKEHLGFDNWETAKVQVEDLRKKASTPAEIKYANDESKRIIESLLEGKTDDLHSYLDARKKLNAAQALDITKVEDAAKILKLNFEFKYRNQNLSPDEVEYLFNKQYATPKKPVQGDELEEEYEVRLSEWKQQVQEAEKGMIIEAKLAKPDLAKYSSELVMPDIPRTADKPKEPTAEELQQAQEAKASFFQAVEKGLSDLKGINAQYKDEEVDIPLSYEIPPEEKAAIKPIVESLYNGFDYFINRWRNAEGLVDGLKVAQDIHLLENQGKVIQRFVNESAKQRMEQKFKQSSNIQLNGDAQRPFIPDAAKTPEEQLQAEVWG